MTGTALAWELITGSPWHLNTSEKMALLVLGHGHDEGVDWVGVASIANWWRCSMSNAREMVTRPRIEHAIESSRRTSKDGKERTFYRLKGWGS